MQDSQGSPEQPNPKVKCQDCGFLAWRNIHTRELAEAESEYRKNPDMSITELARNFQPEPLCYLAAHDIRREIKEHVAISGPSKQESSNKVLHVISKERDCPSYTGWKHGLSPSEHLKMHLLEEQRKREDERDREQREWQAKCDARSQRHQELLVRMQTRSQKLISRGQTWYQTIVGIASAFIAAFGMAAFMTGKEYLFPSNDGKANQTTSVPHVEPPAKDSTAPPTSQSPATTPQPPAKPAE
jgi:hypothetical protein